MDGGRRTAPTTAALVLLACLAACGGNPPAPIEDRSGIGSAAADGSYTVRRGDTLYSIAFRFGLDFRRLAAGNGIAPPYTIYPGQRVDLRATAPPRAAAAAAPRPAGSGTSPASSAPGAAPRAAPVPVRRRAGTSPPPPNAAVSAWRWPAAGPVARGFSTTLHKGIDISGGRGDPVRATAPGRVVYAGAGIAGYGKLLIVRHNERFLSAYGHNDVLLVGEGEDVTAGQRIARRGSSGTDRVKLHFEIRRDGKPVDPLSLLPRR